MLDGHRSGSRSTSLYRNRIAACAWFNVLAATARSMASHSRNRRTFSAPSSAGRRRSWKRTKRTIHDRYTSSVRRLKCRARATACTRSSNWGLAGRSIWSSPIHQRRATTPILYHHSRAPSLKIPRLRRDLVRPKRAEPSSHQVHHLTIPLESPLHGNERREFHDLGVVLHELTRHDHVDEPELVLEQQEQRAVRRLRTLPHRDESGDGDRLAAAERRQVRAALRAARIQELAQVLHRVPMDARARRRVIEEDRFRFIERARRMAGGAGRGEGKRVAHAAQRLPAGFATVRLPDVERRGASEMQRVSALKPRPAHDVL